MLYCRVYPIAAATLVPIEIWHEILGYHAADCGGTVEEVSTVDRRFHEIALKTPEYWQKIPLFADRMDKARAWIARTRNLPLTFIIHTPMDEFPDSIAALLEESSLRCEAVILRGSPLVLHWLSENAATFPHMRSLVLDKASSMPPDPQDLYGLEHFYDTLHIKLKSMPALQAVDIAAPDIYLFPITLLGGANLTTLRLRQSYSPLSLESFLYILGGFPLLQNLYIQSRVRTAQDNILPGYTPVIDHRLVLPELVNLEVERLEQIHAPLFLRHLDAINLRHLRLSRWRKDFWYCVAMDGRDIMFPRLETLCLNACNLPWKYNITPPGFRKLATVSRVTIIRDWQRRVFPTDVAEFFPNMRLLRLVGRVTFSDLCTFQARRVAAGLDMPTVELHEIKFVDQNVGKRELDAWLDVWVPGLETKMLPDLRKFLHEEHTAFFPEDGSTPWTYRDDVRRGILEDINEEDFQRMVRERQARRAIWDEDGLEEANFQNSERERQARLVELFN